MVLFDEIEKAHPDVFGVLLHILDDGRLTDGQGRVVNFRNTIVIMTSNIGTELIAAGDEHASARRKILERIKGHFRPEFLNRIDEIVIFSRLQEDDILRIVDIQLDLLRQRLKERHILLSVSKDAKIFLSREGYDASYGARPLKRVIQRLVQDELARKLLEGEFKESDKVNIIMGKKGLEFGT